MLALILLSFIALSAAAPADSVLTAQFAAYKAQFGKVYASAELEAKALAAFAENEKLVAQLNANEPFKPFGWTKFSDMTAAEFKDTYLMKNFVPLSSVVGNVPVADTSMVTDLPDTFDWRTKGGVVTPVKDQGQCGSCWAFSATENIESVWALAGNPLTELSVQQVVSCDTTDAGCDGGDLPTAWKYVIRAGGLETSKDYPYTSGGGDTGTCQFRPTKRVANFTSYEYATRTRNETAMQAYVYEKAPLAVCVDAESWQTYTKGIITNACGKSLDHCVMITGFGVEKDVHYHSVRNSWGTDWGEDGYLRVEVGKDLCGIAQEAMSVYIKK